jgi:hypothetical protein
MATEAKIVLSAEDRASRVIAGLKGNLGSVGAQVSQLASGFGLLGPAIVGGLSAGALAAFLRSTSQSLDALNDLKDATGSSIENISALEDIAARTGTSFDSVGAALIKFNKAINDAQDPGSDAARIFKTLGLNVAELAALDPSVGLLKFSQSLDQWADKGGRARAELLILGKSTRELSPFLRDLAASGQLNATVTTAQAEAAEKFSHQLSALAKNAQDTGRSIFSSLVPALNAMFDRIKSAGGVGAALREQFDLGVGQIQLQRTQDQIAALKEEAADLQATLGKQGEGANLLDRIIGRNAAARLAEVQGELKSLGREEQKLQAARLELLGAGKSTAGAGRGSVNPPSAVPRPDLKIPEAEKIKSPKREEISDARNALAQYIETQQQQLQGLQQISEEQQALNLLQKLGTLGEVPQVRELVLELAKKQDALKQEAEAHKELIRLAKEEAAAQKKLDDQLEEFSGRVDEANKRALTARLEERLLAGDVFSKDELDRIVRGIGGVREEIEKTDDTAHQLGLTFASAFEDAIVSGAGLRDLLKGLEQDILRITVRKLVTEPLAEQFTGALKGAGAGGGLGAFFAGLFGSSGSSGQFGTGVQGFASGTDFVPRDMLALVHRGEKITPAGANARSSAPQITVNVHGAGELSRATLQQLQVAVGSATSRAMRRNT